MTKVCFISSEYILIKSVEMWLRRML